MSVLALHPFYITTTGMNCLLSEHHQTQKLLDTPLYILKKQRYIRQYINKIAKNKWHSEVSSYCGYAYLVHIVSRSAWLHY